MVEKSAVAALAANAAGGIFLSRSQRKGAGGKTEKEIRKNRQSPEFSELLKFIDKISEEGYNHGKPVCGSRGACGAERGGKEIMGKRLSKNAKKQLFNGLFLLLLIGITMAILLASNRELNFENIREFLLGCNPGCWRRRLSVCCCLSRLRGSVCTSFPGV